MVAVRGGSHNGAGLGVCDKRLMIDLSRMKGVRVDPAVCAIRAESGCAQADLTHAAHSFDLAVPVGIISTTGISGLTLGGGTGYLTRKYGLVLGNLLEAAVVLADGRFLMATVKEILICFGRSAALGETLASSPRFTFAGVRWIRCLPVRCSGRWNTHASVLEWYREITQVQPEELYGFFASLKEPRVIYAIEESLRCGKLQPIEPLRACRSCQTVSRTSAFARLSPARSGLKCQIR
jgi:hypothetical protein